ncbi:hypothetical protein ACISGY_01245 [Escherichia coli]
MKLAALLSNCDEDAHTSLRLHRRGYTSAYMRIPQAAGLATESLSAHIGRVFAGARDGANLPSR